MGNIKKAVPLIEKRFDYALARSEYTSRNSFAKIAFPNIIQPYRKLCKYFEAKEIAPDVLDKVSDLLDVDPGYLSGDYSYNKKELKKEFGSDFSDYFKNADFDPDGYHFGNYADYTFRQKQMPIDEHLISYLNSQLFYVSSNDDQTELSYRRFDFHKLDKIEFYKLQGMINSYVERELQSGILKSFASSYSPSKKEG